MSTNEHRLRREHFVTGTIAYHARSTAGQVGAFRE
jgi:hypothetical protein